MEEAEIAALKRLRQELHAYPELSTQEFQTQKRLIDFLTKYEVDARPIGGTGVVCVFNGEESGKTVLLRSDTDALPIQEINDFDHASRNEGVSHKCGHDGHATIMAGVAIAMAKEPPRKGTVVLVFQPAEENGKGAQAVLDDPAFNFRPDFVYALHNLPGYPKHQIVCKEGPFTAAAKSIIVKLHGKTSHAAEPERGINPAGAVKEMIALFESLDQPDLDRNDFALATAVYFTLGEKSYGVSAGYAEVHYTLRTWNNKTMNKVVEASLEGVNTIAKAHNIRLDVSWTEEFDSNMNDPEAVKLITQSVQENDLNMEMRTTPFKWGEDFGLFTKKFRGAMFGVGSGEDCPALHNPDYDFPDEITETGIKMFCSLIQKATNA